MEVDVARKREIKLTKKYVYLFGKGRAEGSAKMKELLGGKGANLAEMTNLGMPVPAGFTISTDVCTYYYAKNKTYPKTLKAEVGKALESVENIMAAKFGDKKNPLLVSVRSGAPVSMPGMMDTILNLGLNDETVEGLITETKNERFAYDAYRRFVQMYGDVVLGLKPKGKDEHDPFEVIMDRVKKERGIELDVDMTAKDLKRLVSLYKKEIRLKTGRDFPEDPMQQLWGAIGAVFGSWDNERAIAYRKINNIPSDWGTAVNVQAMVFGNMGESSGTGVAFTRDPATGEKRFYGEYLLNAQGEDVVAGIRTPQPIEKLEKDMKGPYDELLRICKRLENHYRDMQDMEFTIQKDKLWMLQTRSGKRTGVAAIKIAVDMVSEGLISEEEALMRIDPEQLNQFLRPVFDAEEKRKAIKEGRLLAKALNAGPGAACGKVVFNAVDAEEWARRGEDVILTRVETSPEDIRGMNAAVGILTQRGGMTCIGGDSLILTDKGFFTAEQAFNDLKNGGEINILSYDTTASLPKWKKVIAAGRRKSKVIKIKLSQTARTNHNFLEITPDHKMYTFHNRKLIKKKLEGVLKNKECVCLIDKIPQPEILNTANSEKLAYLVGALLTDGYIQLKRTKGCVTFTQKKESKKLAFIGQVNSYFHKVFGTRFSPPRTKISSGYLMGRYIRGEAIDLISSKRKPAKILTDIKDNLVSWVLSLDEVSSLNFLAGAIDGDGTFHSYEHNRIMIYISKESLAQAIIVTCLKLGIVPQVTVNRNIYNIQILEKLAKILFYTKRVKGKLRKRLFGTKFFAARSIFQDIIDEVNFMGRPRECIKGNYLIDAEKIKRDILPLCCPNPIKPELENVLNSNLRMYRVKKVKGSERKSFVYNFEVDSEVDSKDEIDKNYIVFTRMYTPLLISNSHAALVARQMGKVCVAGCGALNIDYAGRKMTVKGKVIKEGDYISIDGTTGEVINGKVKTKSSEVLQVLLEKKLDPKKSETYQLFDKLMKWADKRRRLGIRTNADQPDQARTAIAFGAEGIGLCRTEHMFFGENKISAMREMILADDTPGRKKALAKLLPMQREDFTGIFKAMKGYPVTIRTLDPPLHEFLPHGEKEIKELASIMNVSEEKLRSKIESLKETNPMLGHRGCRLGIVYPEITEIQTRAVFEAACEVSAKGVSASGGKKERIDVKPEIMIPLVAHINELKSQAELVRKTAESVMKKYNMKIDYLVGTMIELPRAAITADEIAEVAEFFSFGTNDLTQTTFGLSRDDAGQFLVYYYEKGILKDDPFQTIDKTGVGALVKIGVERGRSTRKNLKIGICGEHGGDPRSVEFCHDVGLDYVSCSPYRVPIARLAAAQAALKGKNKAKGHHVTTSPRHQKSPWMR